MNNRSLVTSENYPKSNILTYSTQNLRQIEMAGIKIVLMGDSILDNFYWLENKEEDLTYLLIKKGYLCSNLAVDESQLVNVIGSIKPRDVYANARPYAYPVNENGIVEPLRLARDIAPDFTILSVGGNDFRTNIFNLLFGFDYFISTVLSEQYKRSYEVLVGELKKISKKVVLVSFYTPYLGPGSQYAILASYRERLRDAWNGFIFPIAKKYHCKLIDLDKLFDPYDRTDYGSTEIEPSNKTNAKIAEVIASIAG